MKGGSPNSVAVTEQSASSAGVSEDGDSTTENKARMGTGEGILRSKLKDLVMGKSSTDSSATLSDSPTIATNSTIPITQSPIPIDPRKNDPNRFSSSIPRIATPHIEVKGPAVVMKAAKRTLYTANVGDARAVLSLVKSFYQPVISELS